MKTIIVRAIISTDDGSRTFERQNEPCTPGFSISENEYKRLIKSSVNCLTQTVHGELFTIRAHMLDLDL